MSRLREEFTTITWVMIPVAIAINIAIGTLIYAVKFPFVYLDSIGTVLVGVLAGPWAGLLTGLLSNLIWGVSGLNPAYTPYFIVGGVIGLFAGLFSRWGWFRTWWKAILAGVITGVIAAAISAPITAYVYGGVTGAGTDVITAFFRSMGFENLAANFIQGLAVDPLDKGVSFLIVYLIAQLLPLRFIARFPRAEDIRTAEASSTASPS
jgi:energy-coupling factor transport system substrate-specific component